MAANLPAQESELAPLPRAALESLGVVLAGRSGVSEGGAAANVIGETAGGSAESNASDRERAVQLEGQQKLWRWVVVLLMVVLVIESWLAGRRGAVVDEVATGSRTGQSPGATAT